MKFCHCKIKIAKIQKWLYLIRHYRKFIFPINKSQYLQAQTIPNYSYVIFQYSLHK